MTMVKNFDASRAAKALASDAEPWTGSGTDGPMQLRATAKREFMHDHGAHADQLTRDNCAACVLLGMERTKAERAMMHRNPEGAPNHCAWLRIYIEAGVPVPEAWFNAEMAAVKVSNPAYYGAVLRSIKTFGIYIGKEV